MNGTTTKILGSRYNTTLQTYRKIVIPLRYENLKINDKFIRYYNDEWAYIIYKINSTERGNYFNPFFDILYFGQPRISNHALIDKGIGFWLNDHEIVTGYRLRKNPSIIRPIFSHNREKIFEKIKFHINRYTKFDVSLIRQTMIKKELMYIKKFPVDIINEILKWTYDPMILL